MFEGCIKAYVFNILLERPRHRASVQVRPQFAPQSVPGYLCCGSVTPTWVCHASVMRELITGGDGFEVGSPGTIWFLLALVLVMGVARKGLGRQGGERYHVCAMLALICIHCSRRFDLVMFSLADGRTSHDA